MNNFYKQMRYQGRTVVSMQGIVDKCEVELFSDPITAPYLVFVRGMNMVNSCKEHLKRIAEEKGLIFHNGNNYDCIVNGVRILFKSQEDPKAIYGQDRRSLVGMYP